MRVSIFRFEKWLKKKKINYYATLNVVKIQSFELSRTIWEMQGHYYSILLLHVNYSNVHRLGVSLRFDPYRPGDDSWAEAFERECVAAYKKSKLFIELEEIQDEKMVLDTRYAKMLQTIAFLEKGRIKKTYLPYYTNQSSPHVGFMDDKLQCWWFDWKEEEITENTEDITCRPYPYGYCFIKDEREREQAIADYIRMCQLQRSNIVPFVRYHTIADYCAEKLGEQKVNVFPKLQNRRYIFEYKGKAVAGVHDGYLWTSQDGIAFETAKANGIASLKRIVGNGKCFAGIAGCHIYISYDLVTWEPAHTSLKPFGEIIWMNGLFVGWAGDNIGSAVAPYGIVVVSPDGLQWTTVAESFRLTGCHVLLWDGNKLYVGCDRGTLYFTEDFDFWEIVNIENSNDRAYIWPHCMERFGNGTYFLYNNTAFSVTYLLYSEDGYNFREIKRTKEYKALYICQANDTLFLCCENGGLYISADGLGWKLVKLGKEENVGCIIHINGTYFAYGENGSIWQSDDLKNWDYKISDADFCI